jgi:hypothetical protein
MKPIQEKVPSSNKLWFLKASNKGIVAVRTAGRQIHAEGKPKKMLLEKLSFIALIDWLPLAERFR